jgi:peptidyl-tRNA hydrolase
MDVNELPDLRDLHKADMLERVKADMKATLEHLMSKYRQEPISDSTLRNMKVDAEEIFRIKYPQEELNIQTEVVTDMQRGLVSIEPRNLTTLVVMAGQEEYIPKLPEYGRWESEKRRYGLWPTNNEDGTVSWTAYSEEKDGK